MTVATLRPAFAADRALDQEAPPVEVHVEKHLRMPSPLDGLGSNVADAFSGTNLLFYAGAVASTAILVTSGADQEIRVYTQRHLAVSAYGQAAVISGYLLPLLVAPGIYVIGLFEDPTIAAAGAAAVQALGVTLLATSALKWATGRPFPNHGGDPNDPARLTHAEYAREFTPFNFDRAWAWPSGHTSSTISIAASLAAFFPEQPWIPAVGYPVSLAIGIGMINGDHHWASDVLAGALLGHAVGYTIGRNFRRLYREPHEATARTPTWEIVPMAIGARGLVLQGTF
jgi:membrane-associated phospholipid phosphatase